MSYRLQVQPEILTRHPDYVVVVVYASNLTNRARDEESIAALREAESHARKCFGAEKASSHPHIAAWREAFSSFGAKPSRYPCSVEALLSRVFKGQELPAINALVDLYNAVSIRHVLPVGGEDLDQLTSDLWLRYADGTEPFDSDGAAEGEATFPEPGEVIWVDSTGVTCRRWNWRQGHRTRLTTDTRSAYFVLDRLAPYSLDDLYSARDELISSILTVSPDAEITIDEIDQNTVREQWNRHEQAQGPEEGS